MDKTCIKCGETKPISDFLLQKERRGNCCSACLRAVNYAWQELHRDQRLAKQREVTQGRVAQGKCRQCKRERLPHINIACEHHYLAYIARNHLQSATNGDVEILRRKLVAQDYKCPYTGDTLVLGLNCHLDHILPKSRFPEHQHNPDNLQWVSSAANLSKKDKTAEEFLDLCEAIARRFR